MIEETARIAAIISLAAVAGEGAIEFIVSPILDWLGVEGKPRVVIFNMLSAALGVYIAFNFHLGFFLFLGSDIERVWVDFALTGCLIGRGSNYIHGLIRQFILKN